ncbi:CinA family protein [Chelatococcus reniformis]|uniref:Damage-inducible protein n=1 Tax=Chelatococcus reniformis TaxID=1494448 RepID=A0A916UMJ3_9HYPH|nr:CinA family protein [Chelatococcus reniformis]GGC79190.1 damage-inducible protein [Chelatococcus reniformis]
MSADTIPPSLTRLARTCAERLIARQETIGISESSAGGLVAAALLAVPGASAYFLGASVTYARPAARGFLGIERLPPGVRSSTEAYAAFMAETVRLRLGATWGLCETGAAGPSTNRYGDPTGHTCLAIAGPVADTRTLRTGLGEREPNMIAFAEAALQLLHDTLAAKDS